MARDLTAIVLSPAPVDIDLPVGVVALNHCERFSTTAGIHAARRRALAKVETPWCFFLDSDDALPVDAAEVLAECTAAETPLAYTDEEVRLHDGSSSVRRASPYSQAAHIRAPMMLHHLVVMRTEAAQAALRVIPAGELWIEMLLYFQIAKGGATYVPRVGYIWNRGPTGMHKASGTVAAQLRAASWCARSPA